MFAVHKSKPIVKYSVMWHNFSDGEEGWSLHKHDLCSSRNVVSKEHHIECVYKIIITSHCREYNMSNTKRIDVFTECSLLMVEKSRAINILNRNADIV